MRQDRLRLIPGLWCSQGEVLRRLECVNQELAVAGAVAVVSLSSVTPFFELLLRCMPKITQGSVIRRDF